MLFEVAAVVYMLLDSRSSVEKGTVSALSVSRSVIRVHIKF